MALNNFLEIVLLIGQPSLIVTIPPLKIEIDCYQGLLLLFNEEVGNLRCHSFCPNLVGTFVMKALAQQKIELKRKSVAVANCCFAFSEEKVCQQRRQRV